MANNKKKRFSLVTACIFFTSSLLAQDKTDTINDNVLVKGKYGFVLYAGGGLFTYLASVGSSGTGFNTAIVRTHATGTLRIMWYPDHRLRVGLESGYADFYSYKLKNGNSFGNVRLSGIPILAVFSMAITKRINVFAGIGSYLINTRLQYNGKVTSNALSLGVNGAVNYMQPITRRFGIGAELKWIEASTTRDYGLSAQVLLVYKFLEW